MAGLTQRMEPSSRRALVPDSSDLTQGVSNLRGLCLECRLGKSRLRASGLRSLLCGGIAPQSLEAELWPESTGNIVFFGT